ncbi:hypothetical protein F5Y06DRAFT_303833 [Hypoxylon sp. FL0890]|nr:hypothetical protein F5Y06DRAFT_303833 [Hypoxylon sp. FL0890]
MSTRLRLSGIFIFFASLLLAMPGDATRFRASPHAKVRAKPLPVTPSTNLQFGVTVDRFSAVDPKRSTVNMTEIYDRHAHKLARRSDCDPTPREQECRRPPAFPMPSCFWCPKPAVLNGNPLTLLATFTTDEFKKRTRAEPADLVDTCMFYSKTAFSPPKALSRVATQLACQYGKYSIWHLWPNKKNEQNNNALLDFYGIFDPENRLYPISQAGFVPRADPPKAYFRVYFENMSEAMAQMCTGKIYVLSQTPQNLAQYGVPPLKPNIWNDKELPALRRHLQELDDSLIAIDATQLPNVVAWRVNWKTLDSQGAGAFPKRTEEIWEPYNMTSELEYGPWTQKRAELCADSGVDEEPDGYDLFG